MPNEPFSQRLQNTQEKAKIDVKNLRAMSARDQWKDRPDLTFFLANDREVEKKEMLVSKLSRFPRSLFSSHATKVKAMQDLMLAQAYRHSYTMELQRLEATNPAPLPKQDIARIRNIEKKIMATNPHNMDLIHDDLRLTALFSTTALELPEVKELSQIVSEATQRFESEGEQLPAKSEEQPEKLSPLKERQLQQTKTEQALLQKVLEAQQRYDEATSGDIVMLGHYGGRTGIEQLGNTLTEAQQALEQFRAENPAPAAALGPSVDTLLRGEPVKFSNTESLQIPNKDNVRCVKIPDTLDPEHLKALKPYLLQTVDEFTKQPNAYYLKLNGENNNFSLPAPKGKNKKHTGRAEKKLAAAVLALYEAVEPPTPVKAVEFTPPPPPPPRIPPPPPTLPPPPITHIRDIQSHVPKTETPSTSTPEETPPKLPPRRPL